MTLLGHADSATAPRLKHKLLLSTFKHCTWPRSKVSHSHESYL